MPLNRVVITGCGVITPIGRSVGEMMDGLAQGVCGTRALSDWNRLGPLRCQVGAPVEIQNPTAIPRQFRRTMSRMSIMAVQAADQALAQAGIPASGIPENPRIGCVLGSTTGSPEATTQTYQTLLAQHEYTLLGAAEFFRCVSHTVTLNVAQYLGIKGMVMATAAACASGSQAIGLAYDLIRLGRQDVILCGGAEELHETVVGSFDILYAASSGYNDSPSRTPRPFDRDRDGLVCGEGAGVLVLECLDHAKQRGANILAEVVGYHTCNNGVHVSQSDAASMAMCMRTALQAADLKPEDIGFVKAHATGTLQGDLAEAQAIAAEFGKDVPVSSLKGHLGHTLGGSGAIELVAVVEMMRSGVIYPTRNLENIDPACAGIGLIQDVTPRPFRAFLSNSFAFGGINAAIACAAYE
jgi:3-oxoacyl-[acyl-carrier-protein] synthase II